MSRPFWLKVPACTFLGFRGWETVGINAAETRGRFGAGRDLACDDQFQTELCFPNETKHWRGGT